MPDAIYAIAQADVGIPDGVKPWFVLGLGVVVIAVVWWILQGRYLRFAWVAMVTLAGGSVVLKVAGTVGLVSVGEGAVWFEWVSASGWPLAVVACVALACDAYTRRKAKDAGLASAVAAGDDGIAVSGGQGHAIATHGGVADYSTTNVYEGSLELAQRLVTENGDLQRQLGALESEKEAVEKQLADALARVRQQAGSGDLQAQRDYEAISDTGDVELLQKVLMADRDKREKQLREQAPDYIELNREIAAVAYLRGDIANAQSALDKVLALSSGDLAALNLLGQIHLLQGRLGEAEKACEAILAIAETDSHRAVGYGNLGNVFRTRGDLEEAEAMYRKALAINESLGSKEGTARDYGNLGIVFKTRNDLDEAREAWAESVRLYEEIGAHHMAEEVQAWLDGVK